MSECLHDMGREAWCKKCDRSASQICTDLTQARQKLEKLFKECNALKVALEEYGEHTEACRSHLNVNAMVGTGIDVSCDCGLTAALGQAND